MQQTIWRGPAQSPALEKQNASWRWRGKKKSVRLKYEVGAAHLWAQHRETEQENATLEISLKLQNETPIPPQKYKEVRWKEAFPLLALK